MTYLGGICSIVDRCIQASPQGAFRVASPQKLPNLTRKLSHFRLVDLGLWGVEGRGVEVDAGVLVQGVDVDGAPGIAKCRAGVLLDD